MGNCAAARVAFMEKTITVRRTTITFSIWDLGGQREFVNMLPLVCNDAVAILFMFDLSRKSTLNSVKEWARTQRCKECGTACFLRVGAARRASVRESFKKRVRCGTGKSWRALRTSNVTLRKLFISFSLGAVNRSTFSLACAHQPSALPSPLFILFLFCSP
ncbi:hypothetical protein BKA62DRAFT_51725 [Auriculariales sp. MPI-PUGE-AT-0066]|nr:hypothetical protein BKA62DRAFT_51725 [Auriculariales sp. MPI-PUGE-AT-0066]